MHISSALLLLASTLLPLASAATQTGPSTAVASPDGVIVPFTSKLPACASLCGPLFNVQGGCAPPVLTAPSQSCFCSSAVLTPFLQSTAEVATVCGPASCQDTASLQEIQSWYAGYCNDKVVTPTTTSSPTSTATSTSTSTSTPAASKNQSWYG
jgi:hypothetical protein